MNKKWTLSLLLVVILFSGCSTRGNNAYHGYSTKQPTAGTRSYSDPKMKPYVVGGKRYYPIHVNVGDRFQGHASWYGPNFHGKLTANGEVFNMYAMTAAHKTLPMNTVLRVTNRNNGLSTVVRINDRGPFVGTRVIDLSKKAAQKINMIGTGTAPVSLEVLGVHASSSKRVKRTNNQIYSGERKTSKRIVNNPNAKYALQIGSFNNISGAIKVQQKYYGIDGYKTIIKDTNTQHGRVFKVLLKGFKSENEARNYKNNSMFGNSFIVTER